MLRSLVLSAWALAALAACKGEAPGAYARRVSHPSQLIGGPSALGAIGDFELGNDQIRVIIQDQGWSRGFGIFGGGIIDADIARPGARGTSSGGTGGDRFGEYFPALFLQAFDVQDKRGVPGIEIIDDGSDGSAAIIRTRASGGDFLTTVKTLIGAVIPAGLRFETDYILRPGARHVEIVGRVINGTTGTLDLSGSGIASALPGGEVDSIPVPLGDVVLFGAANKVYAPGAVGRDGDASTSRPIGFDLRFSLEEAYKNQRLLPAFPGLVVDHLASSGDGVSYGIAVADSDDNYVWLNRSAYEQDPQAQVTRHSMIVPFMVSAFAGVFFQLPPAQFPAGEVYEYKKYFVVGYGDVASVAEEIHRIRGTPLGDFEGEVVNALTGEGEAHAQVHVLDAALRPFTQTKTDAHGRFRARLPAGRYSYRVTAPGRSPFPREDLVDDRAFDLAAGKSVYRYVRIPPPALLEVAIIDEAGLPLPAKVMVVGTYAEADAGRDPMSFLFHPSLGEARRASDLTWRDAPEARERRYIEETELTSTGHARLTLRPTTEAPYDVYVTRGPEYERFVKQGVRIGEGERVQLQVRLRHVLDTRDYVSADFHVHSGNSIDSGIPLERRVVSGAAEGLEVIVATDHNWVTDYQPVITRLGLQDWMTSVIGVELSTLEMGHFNGFPLRYDLGATSHFPYVQTCDGESKVNRTSFDWVRCSPQQLFDGLRALGEFGPEHTIVQVNHPRDSVLGYFNQYYLNPYTGQPEEPSDRNFAAVSLVRAQSDNDQFALSSFSYDFDAIEVLTGKRLDALHAFRLSATATDEQVTQLQDHRCSRGHPTNARGELLLRAGGYVAYPGAVDDWLNMLNLGYQFTATGNSDSHGLDDEIGTPRSYIYVEPGAGGARRDLSLAAVSPLEVVDGVRSRRVVATNGPFVELSAATAGGERAHMGSMLTASGAVEVQVDVRAADWIDVDEVVLYVNGEPSAPIALSPTWDAGVSIARVTQPLSLDGRDLVIVAEVRGDRSMFPVVTPNEDPPNTLAAALGSLTASFGLQGVFASNDGITSPAYMQKVTPYAITNPVWIDANGNGRFDAPGPRANVPQPAPDEPCPQMLRAAAPLAPTLEIFVDSHEGGRRFAPGDIRKIFHGHHAH